MKNQAGRKLASCSISFFISFRWDGLRTPLDSHICFEPNGDGTYYPVESYDSMRDKAVDALMSTGMTRAEAEAVID